MPAPSPALQFLAQQSVAFEPYVTPEGHLVDPVIGETTQYATAYLTHVRAVLATHGFPDLRAAATRSFDAALAHVLDTDAAANPSGFDPLTAELSLMNHRDFFWPPLLKSFLLLRENNSAWQTRTEKIRSADILKSFRTRPPSNWAAVWLSGEILRMNENLSPISPQQLDDWLAIFFNGHITLDAGFYHEPGHSNSYDLFTRTHFADLAAANYKCALQDKFATLLRTGLTRSLGVQLSDGSLASAHRSTGQAWTLGAQIAFFTRCANAFATTDPALASAARQAAQRAFVALTLCARPNSLFSPVQNILPPNQRIGYEVYTADAHYSSLALGFLATAITLGFTGDTPLTTRPTAAFLEHSPTFRGLLHHKNYSAHFNAFPSQHYDGYGLVDFTTGPNRRLQFASSVRHLSQNTFHNLGIAHRTGPGRSGLKPLAAERPMLIEPLRATGPSSLLARSQPLGEQFEYRHELALDDAGLHVTDSTPGLTNHKSLLIPHLLDAGTGEHTQVQIDRAAEKTTVLLTLGNESLRLTLDAPIDSSAQLVYGFQNRRGHCALLRLDLTHRTESVRYHLTAEK